MKTMPVTDVSFADAVESVTRKLERENDGNPNCDNIHETIVSMDVRRREDAPSQVMVTIQYRNDYWRRFGVSEYGVVWTEYRDRRGRWHLTGGHFRGED